MTEATKPLRVKIDGSFVVVEGNCPMCDWNQSHSHIKTAFHDYIDEKKGKKVVTAGAVTKADPLALPKTTHPSAAGSRTTKPAVSSGTTKTTKPPAKKTNVYRIRTVGGGLTLDRSILGDKKKEAVVTACDNHERMLNLAAGTVALTFCRYIGHLEIPEPSSHGYYGRYGGIWDWDV